jgi:hypothetical protein
MRYTPTNRLLAAYICWGIMLQNMHMGSMTGTILWGLLGALYFIGDLVDWYRAYPRGN